MKIINEGKKLNEGTFLKYEVIYDKVVFIDKGFGALYHVGAYDGTSLSYIKSNGKGPLPWNFRLSGGMQLDKALIAYDAVKNLLRNEDNIFKVFSKLKLIV